MALNPAKKAELTQEMEKIAYFETTERERANIQQKNRFRNLTRYLNIERQEREESNSQNEKVAAALREKQVERENTLARELATIKREEMTQQLLRQQLRETSPELRDLERKLQAAYIRKDLSAQIAQKEAEKLNEKIKEIRGYDLLKQAWINEEELKKTLKQEDIYKKAEYRKELQEQMILKDRSKRYLYEEFLKEKKMIDDIVQRIHDEDEREIAEKMMKMRKTQEEMVAFKAAQDMWKKRKQDEIEEENRKIQEFLMSKAGDLKMRLEAKERKEARKAQISENIAKQIYAEQAKQKEREDIVQELLLEEQKEAVQRRFRKELDKKIRQGIETKESLMQQMKERQEKLRAEAIEDEKYKDQLMVKIAEDNKFDQLSNEKRRLKMLLLRKDVEKMIIERRQKHAEEMQLEIKLKEQEEYEVEQRRRIIEAERISMLKDHIENLIGYLPKGLLKEEDIPHLGSEIMERVIPPKNKCP